MSELLKSQFGTLGKRLFVKGDGNTVRTELGIDGLVDHPNLRHETLDKIAGIYGASRILQGITDSDCPVKIQEFAKSDFGRLRWVAANASDDLATLELLTNDSDSHVRRAALCNPHTPSAASEQAALNEDEIVRLKAYFCLK